MRVEVIIILWFWQEGNIFHWNPLDTFPTAVVQ